MSHEVLLRWQSKYYFNGKVSTLGDDWFVKVKISFVIVFVNTHQ